MKIEMFSAFDVAVGAYMQPFFSRTKGEAIRGFTDVANDPKHTIGAHAADYTLMHLGTWDDTSGEFIGLARGPEKVVTGLEVIRSE